ncbi:MAG TPA: squalene synthase HpnC [Planctomycetota bacterium]|nr:squalene synthase HpnC [Planctomycetota bacterium]
MPSVNRDTAFEACARLARTHYENFTVGSFLLPRGTKKHIHALYAYARTTDDIGDESEGDRLANLDAWEEDFRRIRSGSPRHPIHVALIDTLRKFDIPDEPFLKLIEANRIDQRRTRHETFKDLLHYCDHSANPCGRLVLYVFGVRDREAQRLSDFTCTALQLVNFWQDLAIDWAKGRVYIPQEDLRRFEYSEAELARGEATEAFRELMQVECSRTRAMFERGLPLADRLRGTARFDVRLFSRGGMRVLDLIERAGYDVFRRRPTLSKLGKARLALETVLGIRP